MCEESRSFEVDFYGTQKLQNKILCLENLTNFVILDEESEKNNL